MAIDKRLQVFDSEGNPVDYDILASDVKLSDGKDLPTKLGELEEEIGSGGYTPPQGGIPATDLAPAVQTSLGKAETAYQKPASGIPASDIASGVIPDVSQLATKSEVYDKITADGRYVQKETGKGLSTNDYTNADKTKLANIAAGAEVNVIDGIIVGNTEVQPVNKKVTIPAGQDGKSAYEIAVDNGFSGTETEWLASLKGRDGVASGDDVVVVHDLDGEPSDLEQGQVAVLGADVGEAIEERLNDLEEGGAGLIAAFVGNKLVITNNAELPMIKLNKGSIAFPTTEENDTKTASFVVTGKNLTGAIALTLNDESGMFNLSANSIPAANANTPQTIVVTYAPTAIGTHSATITLTSGEASNTITLQGTAVEEIIPEININDGTSATIVAPSGETATKQIAVSANYLSPNEVVSFAIEGTNEIGVSPATLTANENGHIEAMLTLSYTAGSTDASGTLVASCQTIPSTSIGISGHVATRLAEGSYFEIDGVRYTILTDTTKVSAKAGSSFVSGQDVYIPAKVNDGNSVVYDSSGNQISSSGLDYSVIAIAKSAFSTKSVGNVTIEEGVTTMGFRAFYGYASDIIEIGNISLPSTMIRFELTSNISQAFGQRSQASTSKVVALCERGWQRQIFPFKVYHIVLGNPSTMSVSNNADNSVFMNIDENGIVEISALTPPTMLNFFTTTPGTVESPTFPSVTLYVPDTAVAAYKADTTWTSVFAVDNIKGMSQKPSNL